MARPKVHGERVEWKVRLPVQLAAKIDSLSMQDRNATIVRALEAWVVAPPLVRGEGQREGRLTEPDLIAQGQAIGLGKESPETSNCPHKYRVNRGQKQVCAACGDERG